MACQPCWQAVWRAGAGRLNTELSQATSF